MNETDEKWSREFARRRALAASEGGEFELLLASDSDDRVWAEWGGSLEPRLEEILGNAHHALLRSRLRARPDESTLVAVLRLIEASEQSGVSGLPMTLVPPSLDPRSGLVVREGAEPVSDAKDREAR